MLPPSSSILHLGVLLATAILAIRTTDAKTTFLTPTLQPKPAETPQHPTHSLKPDACALLARD